MQELLKIKRVSDLINFIPDPTFVINTDGIVIAWNLEMERLTGVSATQMLGKGNYEYAIPFYGYRRPILIDMVSGVDKQYLDSYDIREQSYNIIIGEAEIPNVNGRDFTYLWGKASPIKDENGATVGYIESIRDISDYKATESALKEANELNTQIANGDMVGIIVCDMNLKYIMWNSFMETLTGINESTILGKNCYDSFPFLKEQKIDRYIDAALRGETSPNVDLVFKSKQGNDVWVCCVYKPLRNAMKNIIGVICTVTDITKRKNMERELADQLHFLQILIDSIPSPIFYKDINAVYMGCNTAFSKYLGLPKNDIIGKKVDEVAPPRLANIYKYRDSDLFENYDKIQEYETKLYNQSTGEDADVVLTKAAFKDSTGEVKGIVGIASDIGARKEAEKQIRQLQKIDALGTLAGGIAHDFNNILSAIFGYAELAMAYESNNPKTKNAIKKILSASDRARSLIKQILVFTHKSESNKTNIQIKAVAEEAVELIRAVIPKMIGIEFICDRDSVIFADPTQIHQILINLCVNASHAIGEKSGSIKIILGQGLLPEEKRELLDDSSQLYAYISVKDDGCGIAMDMMDKIFDPFFTTKPMGEGSGLGLSVVHGIVRGHEGFIYVRSEVNVGTTFDIYFPINKEVLTVGPDNNEMDFTVTGNQNILFVDDEIILCELAQYILESQGYNVTTYTNPVQALERYEKNPNDFDMIVTDYTMPYISGVQLVESVRKLSSKIPIVICTGRIDSIPEMDGITMISKPYTKQKLLSSIYSSFNKCV